MALWNTAKNGVKITRVSKRLNHGHPYAGFMGDPLTDDIYRRENDGGFVRIETLGKPCPPIVWPPSNGTGKMKAKDPTINISDEKLKVMVKQAVRDLLIKVLDAA